jgi:two-component system, NtrC family, response regulator
MNRRMGHIRKTGVIMSRAFLEELQIYDWPGNVRELYNTLDLVCAEAGDGITLFPHHLPEYIRAFNIRHRFKSRRKDTPAPEKSAMSSLGSLETMPSLKDHIENTKALYLQHLTSLTRGNIKESCKISGLSRGHLYRLMQQHDIKKNADS